MKRMMMNVMIGVMLLGTVTSSFADEREGKIARRKENQQKRIGRGVSNGSLTPRETAHLEKQESNLNKETHTDRAANDGKLTPAEKQQVNRQQNHLSKEIYTDKHNGATQQP